MEEPRNRQARAHAETALVRLVHHYGETPEFVVLGGLVPDLLCTTGDYVHAGTTDVDVQVNLEIQTGTANGPRLERALNNAGFVPDSAKVWRWVSNGPDRAVIKFELLADLDDVPREVDLRFDGCEHLGAVNLRGTGFATRDYELRTFTAMLDGSAVTVDVRVAGLAGYLLAKIHAARSRRLPKDFYDIVFVLLNHDLGGIDEAVNAVRSAFPDQPSGDTSTALDELALNFTSTTDQGPSAYAEQMLIDHPDLEWDQLVLDAVTAIQRFVAGLR